MGKKERPKQGHFLDNIPTVDPAGFGRDKRPRKREKGGVVVVRKTIRVRLTPEEAVAAIERVTAEKDD